MPTYEYRCKDCRHQFDAVQSFTDDALTVCPTCGGALKKLFGSVGITFKGSGFYKTDSRAGTSKGDGADTSAEKSGEKSPEKVGAGKDGSASSDSSSNGSSGSSGKDSGSSSGGHAGKGGKKEEGKAAATPKSPSKSGSGS